MARILSSTEAIMATKFDPNVKVGALYEDTVIEAMLKAQDERTRDTLGELLNQYTKGAHVDSEGFCWHFEIPKEKLKELFPNYNW